MAIRPQVFISYRREDSREWATLIYESLRSALGPDAVFMDVDNIRSGDDWNYRIEEALDRATVILPIIGQRWLFVQDSAGRRRIDAESDWVRREIETALGTGKHLLPLVIAGTPIPGREMLPPSIQQMVDRQFTTIHARRDIDQLVTDLVARFGFVRLRTDLDYPPPVDKAPALSERDLAQWLSEHPDWNRIERPLERGRDGVSHELVRVFKFRTFQDAIHYMVTASRFITQSDHHPFWENQYLDLRVTISTWDVGHRISYKDTRLAEYLERLFRDYAVQ